MIWPMLKTVQYQSEIGNSNIYFSFFAYEGTFSFSLASGTTTRYGTYVIKCNDFPVTENQDWGIKS